MRKITKSPNHLGNPPLVAVAHGSRLGEAKDSIQNLLSLVQTMRPGLVVFDSYIELSAPSLTETLALSSCEPVVVPLLLTRGVHLAQDVHQVAERFGFTTSTALGPDPLLTDVVEERLKQTHAPLHLPIVLAAAGSDDPLGNQDVQVVADELSVRRGVRVSVGYLGSHQPNFFEVVETFRAQKQDFAVATYLLSPGRFSRLLSQSGSRWIAEPLGTHPLLAKIVLARYDQALLGSVQSPMCVGARNSSR